MKNIGEYIIYRRDVCKIINIKEINDNKFYVLEPTNDDSLHIDVPVNTPYIKDLITKEEIKELVSNIKNIEPIEEEERRLEQKYKELLDSGVHENLVRIIKTTFMRNKKREDNKKKISERDKKYFDLAEHYLYDEIGVVLGKTFEETRKYIISNL